MSEARSNGAHDVLPLTLIHLMKGVIERETSPVVWQGLMQCTAQVRDHVGVIGLELTFDEAEGYAYLRQRPEVEGETSFPRLVPRRQLGYSVSLLLALLRRRLAEADANSGDTQLVLARGEIHDLVRHLSRDASNEARQADRLDRDIDRIVELGFLRQIRRDADTFEVRRILAAFVNAQWLSEFDQRLAAYAAHARSKQDTAEDA